MVDADEFASYQWSRLMQAKALWYHVFDFQFINTPFWVSQRAIEMTYPRDLDPIRNRFKVEGTDRYLVASGEQSFCQMMLDGKLAPGKYCTLTPCFRDDPEDDLHSKHFMKLEAIDTTGATNALDRMIDIALTVFGRLALVSPVVVEGDGYDIEINNIEVGSYGFREAGGFGWAYGTALAEPRFSIAVSRQAI